MANPKLKISVDVHDRPDKPIAAFHYIDGSEVRVTTLTFSLFDVRWIHRLTFVSVASVFKSNRSRHNLVMPMR